MNATILLRRPGGVLLVLVLLAGGLVQGGVSADGNPVVLPVTPTPFRGAAATIERWPVLDGAAAEVGTADWRVVTGTGNCCENFLLSDARGRLHNWGGTWVIYSDDDGLSWSEVASPATSPVDSGEGAIGMGPGGDVLGTTWDPYQGDRLMTFAYDAGTDAWRYAEQPLHLPFYDRPWFTTVPGTNLGTALGGEYLSVARGAYPSKDVLQYSGDGLTYPLTGSKKAEAAVTAPITGPLPVRAYADADWVQPHAETSVVPLGGGYAFGGQEFILGGVTPCSSERYLMTPDLAWHCYEGGVDVQWHVADSSGALHAAEWSPTGTLTHRMSTDGGLTVTDIRLAVPPGLEVGSDIDIRANAEIGVVAIAASGRDASDVGQHLVFKVTRDEDTGQWAHTETLLVGDGDLDYGSGVGAGIRFDFASIALLPDGRVALSFNDATRRTPAVAIEMATGSLVEGQGGAEDTPSSPLQPFNPS